jgi:hypothetical protein
MRSLRSLRVRAAIAAAGVTSVVAVNHFGLSLVLANWGVG